MSTPAPASHDPRPTDTARLHLELLGEQRTFEVTVGLGRRTPLDLLPAARELTGHATAVAVTKAEEAGKRVSCRPGCGACCRQLVAVSVIEAVALADVVNAMPGPRRAAVKERFGTALNRLEAAQLLNPIMPRGERSLLSPARPVDPTSPDAPAARKAMINDLSARYFALQIPCPFLEDESCGIHPERPLVCREYHVTSPAERCAKLGAEKIDAVAPPLHMSGVLARTAAKVAGTSPQTIPLVLALEWAEANGAKLGKPLDGKELFFAMLGEIDADHEKGFDQRG